MQINKLKREEKKIIFECLNAVLAGPFIPEETFPTLMGIGKSDLKNIISVWPDIDENDYTVEVAIKNSLTLLIIYPHNCEKIWNDYISASKEELDTILFRLSKKNIKANKSLKEIEGGTFVGEGKKLWDQFSEDEKEHHINNVWCLSCLKNTTIIRYEGAKDVDGGITIYGYCIKCFARVEKIIGIDQIPGKTMKIRDR